MIEIEYDGVCFAAIDTGMYQKVFKNNATRLGTYAPVVSDSFGYVVSFVC